MKKGNNNKKKFLLILLLIIVMTLVGSVYYINKIRIIFPDKQTEQTVKNIIGNNMIIYYYKEEEYIDEFNEAINAFGGIEKLTLNNNVVEISFDGDNVLQYKLIYTSKSNKEYGDYEKYYEYMCKNYKYYNENILEIYLEMYKCRNYNDLSVNDIKEYVDEGNNEKKDEIHKYIKWYENYGYSLYNKYDIEYMKKIREVNGNYVKKYNGKILDDLSIEEQKEVIKDLYNEGLVE